MSVWSIMAVVVLVVVLQEQCAHSNQHHTVHMAQQASTTTWLQVSNKTNADFGITAQHTSLALIASAKVIKCCAIFVVVAPLLLLDGAGCLFNTGASTPCTCDGTVFMACWHK